MPLFASHAHFVQWTEEQLQKGTMQNVRHLWISVRPNGDNRPYNLNRLELRICDLIANPITLLAVCALLEARLTQMLSDTSLDPLSNSQLPSSTLAEDLLEISQINEQAVAKNSLDAQLRHWQDGQIISAQEWIEQLYDEVSPIAKQKGFSCFLSPLKRILREGNQAQKWLKDYNSGREIPAILQQGIKELTEQEQELEAKLFYMPFIGAN